MNLAELFKKNIILIPVVASILVGTFTSIRYVLNLTSTIDESKVTIIKLESELKLAQKATWQMAENLYRQLADEVREHSYDIKDLNR